MSSDSASGVPLVLSGPSGVGKTTLTHQILAQFQDISQSISATTRSPRMGEVPGKDYIFMSTDEFKKSIDEDLFLEHAVVHGEYYGTPKGPLEERLSQGTDVLLVIDVQGGAQIKKIYPQAVLIFVLPPSMEVLEQRITERGGDDQESLDVRLQNARDEVSFARFYDYWVVNRDLEEAISQIRSIIVADRCQADRARDLLRGFGFSWPGLE